MGRPSLETTQILIARSEALHTWNGVPSMERTANGQWVAQAAYLYTLRLDDLSLAWEYLRRNPRYQEEFGRALKVGAHAPANWGLQHWEDPSNDARDADPMWSCDASVEVRLVPLGESLADSTFGLWSIPGTKWLQYDGNYLIFSVQQLDRVRRARIAEDDLADGPYGALICASSGLYQRWRRAKQWMHRAASVASVMTVVQSARPSATAMLHMQTFQSLDGRAARASHRQIAAVVFGAQTTGLEWNADSEWRSRVRYLLKRGAAQCERGYRRLAGLRDRP
jgi:hypothetical protein